MPVWQWLLDAAGVLLLLVLLYGIALIVRRRVLSRNGGTFELSYRVRPAEAGRGWLLGLGRYSGETPGVVPHLLALPAAQALVAALGADLRRPPGARGRGADVALPRPRRDLLPHAPRARWSWRWGPRR